MLGGRITGFLREHGWVVNLLLIALGAYFVAGAANALLARNIRVVPALEDAASRTAPQPQLRGSGAASYGAIAERNLLGAKRENLNPQALADSVTMVSGRKYREADLKPCSAALTVRATLVADSAPEWSVAVLYNNGNSETNVFSINDGSNTFSEDAVVVDIRGCQVVLRRRDHFELCQCESGGTGWRLPEASESEDGAANLTDRQFTLARGQVDNAFATLSELAAQARIVPSFKDGKPNGFKVFSIQAGGFFSQIGLENGDVVQKLNGYEMNSPDKALEIYQKLKNAASVTMDLQRRGQGLHYSYEIR